MTKPLSLPYETTGLDQWFLFMSDNHHDSYACNRNLEKAHLEEALRKRASIFILGDFFDAMNGKADPRRNMDELRPEYKRLDYFDFVVKDSAKFLAPYAKQIAIVAQGNHESAVLENNNTDLTDRLVYTLNTEYGAHAAKGGYGGWIRLMMRHGKTPEGSIKIKYFHGSGGEAPVTRGAIQTARQGLYLPDADIIVNGHSHNSYIIPISRERMSNKGEQYYDVAYHLRVAGYKQEYADGSGGWTVRRGGVPKPIGCIWLHLTWYNKRPKYNFIQDVCGADVIAPMILTKPGRIKAYAQDSEGE